MKYHVMKKRMSPHVREMLNAPQGSWDDHPQSRAYADLQCLFSRDPKELELPALYGLIHRVYGHKTSYEIELEEGSDGDKQINEHLEKIFAYENAPYPIDINQIAFRGKGGSLSVGDLIFVDAPKPMIFMCASVGYVQLSNKFVDAFKSDGPAIIVGEECINDAWVA